MPGCKNPVGKYRRCARHRTEIRAWVNDLYRVRRENGLCVCGEPATHGAECEFHYDQRHAKVSK